jgi:type II secretory pathway pseudopilin PulG
MSKIFDNAKIGGKAEPKSAPPKEETLLSDSLAPHGGESGIKLGFAGTFLHRAAVYWRKTFSRSLLSPCPLLHFTEARETEVARGKNDRPVMAQMRRGFAAAAFTLLEVCIAITVFSFIMISILGVWKCIVKGKMVAQDAAAAAQRARVGIHTVVQALTCTELDTRNLGFYEFDTDTSSKFAALSLAARLPQEFPGSGLYGDNVMRRVTFVVERDAGGQNNLVMKQSPLLAVLDSQNTPYEITLARDVNVFMLEFWSDQNNEWEVSWDSTNTLPTEMRVTLGCGHSANHPDSPYTLYCRTVALPCAAHQ